MPSDKTQLNIFLSSPSDLLNERLEIKNFINSLEFDNLVFHAKLWEDEMPSTNFSKDEKQAQDIINTEILTDSDIVFGLFRDRYGNKTTDADSGTVGEIEQCIQAGKKVIVYFWKSERIIEDLSTELIYDFIKIKEFKEKYKKKGSYKEVNSIEEIKDNLKIDLIYNANKILANNNIVSNEQQLNKKKETSKVNNDTWYKISISECINESLRNNSLKYYYRDNITFHENFKIALADTTFTREGLEELMNKARIYAFDKKYGNYDYNDDLRSKYKNWHKPIQSIIQQYIGQYKRKNKTLSILDVGGNVGDELIDIVNMCHIKQQVNMHVLDISFRAIINGTEKHSNIDFKQGNMEKPFPFSKKFDICLCLRTIQSRGVFRTDALIEMGKALKNNGLLIISIPNGYVHGETKKIVKGLYDHRNATFSKQRPMKLANKIYDKLLDYNYRNINIQTGNTEIFISGRKGK